MEGCNEFCGRGGGYKYKRKGLILRRKRWYKEIRGLKGDVEKRDVVEEMEIIR